MRPDRFRAYGPTGQVVLIDEVPANGPLRFDCADFVERVVFYGGVAEAEAVLGEAPVRMSGRITVDVLPE